MPATPASLLTRVALAIGAVSACGALGLAVAEVGESTLPSLLFLLAEPLVWVALAVVALYGLAEGRLLRAVAALGCLLTLGVVIRQVPERRTPTSAPDEATPLLRECVAQAGLPAGSVTVASWNTGSQRDAGRIAASVAKLHADVVVLQELRGEPLLQEVVSRLENLAMPDHRVAASEESASPRAEMIEGLFIEAMPGSGSAVLVRGGFFGICGDDEQESWSFALPSAGQRRALATLAMPRVEGVGWVPVLGMHLDRPADPSELAGWGERLVGAGDRVSGFVRALDAPGLVALGDTNAHATFRRFSGAMLGANLAELNVGPTWPALLGGIPSLPLYGIDRVWHGAGWSGGSARTVRLPGSAHLAVVATLQPAARRG